MQDVPRARRDDTEGLIYYKCSHGTKNIDTKRNYVETKGKDKRSKRLDAFGLLLYVITPKQMEKHRNQDSGTTQKNTWLILQGEERQSRGEESNWKKRARNGREHLVEEEPKKDALITLGRRRWSSKLGEVEQDPPSLFFQWMGAECEWLMWRDEVKTPRGSI